MNRPKRILVAMVAAALGLAVAAASYAAPRPADDYISLVQKVIKQTREDLPEIVPLAERCADQLIATQKLGAPVKPPWAVSEFRGRAGGFMNFTWDAKPQDEGVMWYYPGPAFEDMDRMVNAKAHVYAVCPRQLLSRAKDAQGQAYDLSRFAGIIGGPMPEEGLYPDKDGRFAAPIYPIGQIIRGWVFDGEVVAACTRKGKMPLIWKLMAVPNAKVWNDPLVEKVKKGAMFHDDITVDPVPAGRMGNAYLDSLSRDLESLKQYGPAFQKAGRTVFEALQKGGRVHVWAFNHVFPEVLESRPIYQFGPKYSRHEVAVKPILKPGDAQIIMPYLSVPKSLLNEQGQPDVPTILCARILPPEWEKLVGSSGIGEGAAPEISAIAIKWSAPEGDAAVEIPGYGTKLLPESAVMQATTFFCIAAEMAALEQERDKAK